MNLGEIRKIKALLDMFGTKANTDLGQHFLIDQKYLGQILDAAEPLEGKTVLEVGPGMGVLTKPLARKAKSVTAIEIDPRMVEILKTLCIKCNNLTVKTMDIRHFDPTPLGEYKLIANLPYYLTSNVLRKFLEEKNKPKEMVLLVQKEVAERICAMPGKMSLLSVSVQFYGNPKMISVVPRDAFYPTPQVSSAIVKISVYKSPIFSDVNADRFFSLVRQGFGEKRKQLANSLAGYAGDSKEEVTIKLKKAGIDSERRAETLSLADWRSIYKEYYR